MIRSAVTGAPLQAPLPFRQVQWAGIGVVVMLIIASIDYRYLSSSHWYIYGGLVLLLGLVLILGSIGIGSQRWFEIKAIGFNVQPSEIGRVFITVTFGQFLAHRRDSIHRFSNTIATLIYIGIPIGLIFVEPDLGMSILYIVIWFVMVWVAGLPLSHFVALAIIGVVTAVSVFPLLAEYQVERITTFVNPEEADAEDVFNVDQAEISIGSGGPFGKGYFNGTQSQLGFLRVQHTDFIFSVITEEMGLVFGAIPVLVLIGFILFRIIRAAAISPDLAGKYMCTGIAATLFFQTMVNVGMNTRMLPVTGLTLPFVSYGGSSLVTLYMAIGIVQSVLMRHRKQEFG